MTIRVTSRERRVASRPFGKRNILTCRIEITLEVLTSCWEVAISCRVEIPW